ncbi:MULTISPECIES: hypothetical protein [Vibrio]|uniref:hypothetical protein n=1 Tax=Vibrio TaxID=662 RepID=UPI000C820081|nr:MULTISPECIES: hypothetical protein [Vibrio]PMI93949.1 hypothetical protein BCU33_21845 [Vibrio lentus]PTP95688.1 hypothetical protein CWO02_02225 [Vibrio splendidus]
MSKLSFSRKRTAVLPELRPMYKVGKILMILKLCCSGGKASLLKLHLFNWAMLEEKRMQALLLSSERKELVIGVWGIDPSLNMALAHAIAEGLLARQSNGAYKLTTKGEDFISGSKLLTLFEQETGELKVIAKRITEKMVTEASKRWADEI